VAKVIGRNPWFVGRSVEKRWLVHEASASSEITGSGTRSLQRFLAGWPSRSCATAISALMTEKRRLPRHHGCFVENTPW
jgi:hypothetical protein